MRLLRPLRSLAVKLTLAFMLFGLTGALLVAVILQWSTRLAFNQFVVNREQQTLADNLVQYYKLHGSWEGVAANIPGFGEQPGGRGAPRRNHQLYTLVGPDNLILVSGQRGLVGKPVAQSALGRSIPLTLGDQNIGWLIPSNFTPQVAANPPETVFLNSINRATLVSGLVAAALALVLGGLLAFSFTRTLRELTEATNEVAAGKLGRQVTIRSQDELGDLAASFNKMSLDLMQATHARRQMTADIAHDLRTPLSVISGYAEALSDGKLPGSPEVYTILHQETQQLINLVEDLRTLSLADIGELSLALQPSNPRVMLERVAARHALAAQQNGVALEVEAAEDLPQVRVDPERMDQVFNNLVGNALRYTPQGGRIVLSAGAATGKVQFQVRDSGSGIRREDLPHVFDRFYRGDPARPQNGESGLGLAIAKSIVEAHGGNIQAESAPGQGAVFIIEIPAG